MCIKNLINLFFHAYENINWILSKKKKNRKKENLRKEVGERYQNLSEEQKIKKWKNACERYQSFSEEKENKYQYYREHNKNLSED